MKRASPELQFHKAVIAFLRVALPKEAFYCHVPNGGARDARTGAMLKAMGTVAGMPDIIIWFNARCYALELKAPKGRITPSQDACHERLRTAGVNVETFQSIAEIERELFLWGIPVRASTISPRSHRKAERAGL